MSTFINELSKAMSDAITLKYNENHDELGRFSGGGGGSSGGDGSGGRPFGEWGASMRDNDLIGYRGVNSGGIGFGNSEGDGVYIARDQSTAQFFSPDAKATSVHFSEPKNPFIVNNEPLYILEEDVQLTQPVRGSDSAWLKAAKTATARAFKKTGGKWDADEVGHQLTKYLKDKGHDAVVVNSGNESWAVLFDRNSIK